MHELAITQSLVDTIVEHTDGRQVVRVRLEIGTLSGVEVDAVRFCFDVVTSETTLAGAELEIDRPAGRGRCRACRGEFAVTDLLAGCACGSLDIEITGGEQLRIRDVEVARNVRDVRV